ncbi:MAG: site-specific integrase [Burkholderiales bacterium]|nr:site-specific integrase [Burkholderiales bacterium]
MDAKRIPGLRQDPDTGEYRIDVVLAGEPMQLATGTTDFKSAAQALEKVRQHLRERAALAGESNITWNELALEHLKRIELRGNRTIEDTRAKLRWLEPHLGHMLVRDIDESVIREVLERRRLEPRKLYTKKAGVRLIPRKQPLRPTTLNRWWALIHAMLRFALGRGYISRMPSWDGHVPEPRGKARVVRWLRPEEAERLLKALPLHAHPVVSFALATGLRKANVLGLCWDQVDLERHLVHISAADAKGKKNLGLPLSEKAVQILRGQLGRHERAVFTYRGRPVRDLDSKAWKTALKRAKIDPRFRNHDLRHTWASWHLQAGTPLEVLRQLGGWSTLDMVMTYAHLSTSHLAQFADNSRRPDQPGEGTMVWPNAEVHATGQVSQRVGVGRRGPARKAKTVAMKSASSDLGRIVDRVIGRSRRQSGVVEQAVRRARQV